MPVKRTQKPLSIDALLTGRSGHLAEICSRASELMRIQRVLAQHLPVSIRDHVQVAGLHGRVIVLQADGPAWAVRLRFLAPDLLIAIRNECGLPDLESARIHVAAPFRATDRPRRKARISRLASEILRKSAESTTDPALRASLLRLSGRN